MTGQWKASCVVGLAVLAAAVGLSCVRSASLQGRGCPCVDPYECCEATQLCVLRGTASGCGGQTTDGRGGIDAAPADALAGIDQVGEPISVEGGADGPGGPGDAAPGLGNGQSCAAGATCASGHCVDGVCCESACANRCAAGRCCADPGCPPVWAWTQSLRDRGEMAAAVGPDGTIFVAGAIYSTAGENSFFVAKLHSDDGRLVWNFQVRGPVVPRAVAVLTDGSVAVAGAYTATLDFDPSPRSDIHPAGPTPATFVTRLMPDGAYAWTRTLMDQPDGQAVVAATPDGGLVLGGLFWDRADLDPTEGVDMHVSANGRDAPYVVKLSADGSYLWGRTFDESDQKPSLQRLAVDGAGNLAVAISLVGTMDVDPGPAVRMIPARPEAPWHVVVGLDGGGQHKWSHVFGIATDLTLPPLQLAFASDGDLVVAGAFRGRADFDATGAHRWVTAPSGASPVFLTRLAGDTGAQRFNGVMTTLGSSRAASLVPAPGAGVVAGIEHDRAIDIDPGQGTITRANAGTSPSFLLVQLSSVGGYVSDTPIPLNGGALAAAGDAQLVVVHLRADSVQEISKYAPRRP